MLSPRMQEWQRILYFIMQKNKEQQKWVWGIYFCLFLFYSLKEAFFFFKPNSVIDTYFDLLRSFDHYFIFIYFINCTRIILNIVHCLPLLLYIYQINFLPSRFWQGLFILRVLFELCGHSYEKNFVLSLYHSDPLILLFLLSSILFFQIPSYFACFSYAFVGNKKINQTWP